MTRHFELEFNDLTFEKQQEMIEAVKADWIEAYKQEGRQEILNQQTGRDGKTMEQFWRAWQKEHACTDDQLILVVLNELYDWEDVTEDWDWKSDGQNYKSLEYDLENEAEKKAEEACWAGVHNMEIEVESV